MNDLMQSYRMPTRKAADKPRFCVSGRVRSQIIRCGNINIRESEIILRAADDMKTAEILIHLPLSVVSQDLEIGEQEKVSTKT